MKRIYESIIERHFDEDNQMLFLAGPRQVGKTTVAKQWLGSQLKQSTYFNWDNQDDRLLILQGPKAVATVLGLDILSSHPKKNVFDEIHKYKHWKIFLKGFYDSYKEKCLTAVTGSAKLDVYKRGGDSLMGRYFLVRVHPFTVSECINPTWRKNLIIEPQNISDDLWQALWEYGGFPEPFLKQDTRFSRRWHHLRKQQLFREDIRDLSRIQEINQLELLAFFIEEQCGQLINYSSLATKIRVSSDTIRRWFELLEEVYFCFRILPWSKNVTRSLLKEPKVYLWDWSVIKDPGKRTENFVASHLLKAVNLWTDLGFGQFDLYFLRDKEKREVDFLVTKDNEPWFLVEVKKQNKTLSHQLIYYQQQLKVPHAFQVVLDMPYVDKDCFTQHTPVVVPARTFLSQLF